MKATRLARLILLVPVAALLCIAQSGSVPASATSRFIGTWKENEAKRKLPFAPQLKFDAGAGGGLEEIRGANAPVREPVRFDGNPYDIGSGNTIVWKQTGRNQFARQLSSEGRVTRTRTIKISGDGKTLTEQIDRKDPDGQTVSVTSIYSRSAGTGTGLAGTWDLQSRHSDNPPVVTLRAAGPNSLAYVNSQGVSYTATLDNKPVPVTGPGVAAGSTIALIRQLDDYTITSTLSRNGLVTGHGTITVSPDGKIMTTSVTNVGPNAATEPSVRVWERQ